MKQHCKENMEPGVTARVWFSEHEETAGSAALDCYIRAAILGAGGKAGVAGPFEGVRVIQPDRVRL
jgi:hypothetical protein